MKKLSGFILALACAVGVFAQTPAPVSPDAKLPTFIMGGVAFNQYATPRVNAFVSAIAPVSSRIGVYESTTADILPVKSTDAATGRTVYLFSTTIRQGAHKVLYNSGKLMLTVGGDAGLSFSQGPAGGTAINAAGSITGTALWQLNEHWAIGIPIRGLWTGPAGWNLIPEAGIVWKP